ncbi:MAG TPA: Eco57I restriction-modification methylase domain-containing protein, partial [Bacteroidales bacterium]|nr:Eco57I restriction-modification methylase domain-containing protein [Bacteroidales bacterium]
IPKNVRINFICNDFLKHNFNCRYDLIIGNPPFLKLKDSQLLKEYRNIVGDNVAKNTSALFLNKSLLMSDNIAMILPKYFLHNEDFKICREKSNNYAIKTIIDFGEKGFKGVLIETICLIISTVDKRGKTTCISITHNLKNILKQSILSDERFPNWMLYRNDFFDNVCKRMKFGIFRCFRDRQITKNMLKKSAKIWVIKSRNVQTDGSGIEHIAGYDSFIDEKNIDDLNVSKYLDRDDVYLCPNMTYYPRVVRKPKGTLVNGSVAILELNDDEKVTDEDLKYFSTDEFWKFYAIARNLSTRSLNIDNTSIYYFGKRV